MCKCHDAEVVSKCMRLFVLDVRKADGEPYPPSTTRGLLSGLNRVMQSNKVPFSMLEKGDRRFREWHLTLDSVSSDLHRKGLGTAQEQYNLTPCNNSIVFCQILVRFITTTLSSFRKTSSTDLWIQTQNIRR